MVWNSISPDGTKSVKQNTTPMQQNTAYTETSLNKDHFWNIGVDEDGHHRCAQTVATNDADKTIQTNIELATGMDGVFFSRFKTALESTAQQDCQPFFKNIAGNAALYLNGVMQLLGIRAMAVFSVSGGVVTVQYSHNIASVVRQVAGRFQITYTNALPSNDYLVLGGGMANTDNSTFIPMIASQSSGASVVARKNTAACIVVTTLASGTLADPIQAWFVMFGG